MSQIRAFLEEIDRQWTLSLQRKIPLRIIGSTALMLQTRYDRITKDSDVIETADVSGAVRDTLLDLAGPNTDLHKKFRLYLDIVAGGLPFLPNGPIYHAVVALQHFDVEALDVTDVVVSKLKRFNANDIGDVREMIDRGHVEHESLVDRFRNAVDVCAHTAFADDLPRYVENFHRVERDFFEVHETHFELPHWI